MSIVTETKENMPDSSHDREEKGIDEYLQPMEEDFWIEQGRDIQVTILENIILHSPLHLTQSAKVQDTVQEDLGLNVGQVGIWSQQNDEGNDVDQLLIH